jgi:hypothetical protein
VSFFTYIRGRLKQTGERKKISVIAVTVGKPGFDIISATKRCEVQGIKKRRKKKKNFKKLYLFIPQLFAVT